MRKITSYGKELLIMAVIFLIEVSAIIRANFYYNDDLGRNIEGYTGNAFDSRYVADWVSIIVGGNKHNTDVSPLTQILACIFLAAAVVAVVYVFTKGRDFTVLHYVCGTLIMSPYFLSNMSYKYDSVFMAMSVFAAVLPFVFWVRDSKVLFYLSSVICLLVMCMTYQASSGIYPMMALMMAFLSWNRGEKSFKESALFLLKCAGVYLVTLAFFALFLMKPIEEGYINTDVFSAGDFIGGVISNYKEFYLTVVGDFMKNWNILAFLLVVLLGVLFVVKSSRNKFVSAGMFVILLALMLLVVFGVYPAFSLTLILPRSMYGFSFFLMVCGFAILTFDGILPWGGKAAILVLSWCLFAFSFTYGNALAQQMKYVDFRVQEVIDDLADLDVMMTDDEKRMVVEGDIGFCPAIENYTYDYVLIKKLVPVYFQGGTHDWSSAYFYRYFKLPNIKRVYTLDDAGEFETVQESAYHEILVNKDNDIIIKLK
ncbi:MAG: glucosyltransferase domain-containing protein [Butyrivibrio sp.]|uniref:glucosyltransferase domain-containing protein n=1 Tax=Butyrivibrio sp. TaxID=28121 RepID=UPI001B5800D3|nr:glucosyltransferase domain-containing protein [Butyrivibrio sp.]MBP3784350.1 glucosyltransferase domain-containing protein [Butyrivibrio sp.]